MDIKNGLKTLQWHSKTAKYILSNIIEILDKLDTLDNINPTTDGEKQDLIGQKDDEQVKFYNCLQAFLDYQEEFRNKLCSTELETDLTSKLLENDTDTDEVIRRSGEVYAGLFQEYYYPNVWEESDFKAKIQSLKTELKDRIVNRLMREDEIPEFKDRLVVSGLNEDFISEEPMTLESAKRKAGDWVLWLDLYLHNVCHLQNKVATILDKAYSTLNPHPDTTTEKEQEQRESRLPSELATPQAMIIWSKAKHNGWVNDDYSFNGTKYQMAYAAECMGKSLKLKHKWKPFEVLWNYKYFPQTRRESKERIGRVERDREIEASFSL